jgi:hypothetical protein
MQKANPSGVGFSCFWLIESTLTKGITECNEAPGFTGANHPILS